MNHKIRKQTEIIIFKDKIIKFITKNGYTESIFSQNNDSFIDFEIGDIRNKIKVSFWYSPNTGHLCCISHLCLHSTSKQVTLNLSYQNITFKEFISAYKVIKKLFNEYGVVNE